MCANLRSEKGRDRERVRKRDSLTAAILVTMRGNDVENDVRESPLSAPARLHSCKL